MASPTPSTPIVPSVTMGTPSSLSPTESWTLMEVDYVIFHSQEQSDHDTVGLELWRVVAARLVASGKVYHPSKLNPWAGVHGRHLPPWAHGQRNLLWFLFLLWTHVKHVLLISVLLFTCIFSWIYVLLHVFISVHTCWYLILILHMFTMPFTWGFTVYKLVVVR